MIEKVGRYEIKGELGRGGMATVYRGYDTMFERDVAIKLMPREYLNDAQFRLRFEREAKTIALLEHPAILPVYDVGEHDGQPYFVMKLMTGGSLADKLRKGALSLDEAVRIIKRLAAALDEAHSKGIIHRDLKPGNILFDQWGDAYISDFGIAKLTQSTQGNMTGSGIIGTPSYMSPEQARGEKDIDGRSDIYALGTMLFEMLARVLPFEADTPIGVAMKHITEPVPNVLELNPDLPDDVQQVIAQAMAKNRDERYPLASQLAQALESVAQGNGVPEFVDSEKTGPWEPNASNSAATFARQPKTKTGGSFSSSTINAKPKEPTVAGSKIRPVEETGTGNGGGINRNLVLMLIGIPAVLVFIVGAALLSGGLLKPDDTPLTATANSIKAITQAASDKLTTVAQVQAQITATAITTQQAQLNSTAQALALTSTAQAQTSNSTQEAQIAATGTAQAQATVVAVATATAQAQLKTPRVAFINANDLWVVDVDGKNIKPLTKDGAAKTQLRWLPDARTISFISGKCVRAADYVTGEVKDLACFNFASLVEGFEVSPDGRYFAVTVDRLLYIGNYDPPRFALANSRAGIEQLATCLKTTVNDNAIRQVRWSRDSKQIAVIFVAPYRNLQADYIRLYTVSCGQIFSQQLLSDSFPSPRFTMPEYNVSGQLQNFGWDGETQFFLIDNQRNDGFGDPYLYIADAAKRPAEVKSIINGLCCYRDISWSLDGKSLVFAFQDKRDGAQSRAKLYYIQYGTLGTGAQYQPIPLPENFFVNASEKPFPAISPTR